MAGKSIYAGILQVQRDVKIPKTNDGGRFKYRSAEDILEKVKPVLHEAGLIVRFSEDIKTDAIGSYIESTCRVIDIATGEKIGTLSDVLNLGASDLYEINTKNGKKLIPAVDEFIKEIDLEKGIFVSLIEGLLD
jgi:hypothetical protein